MHDAAVGGFWALVLAGADGPHGRRDARAWGTPSPYRRRGDGRSALEASLQRVAPLAGSTRTVALVNREHLPLAAGQLAALPSPNVLVQPRSRGTGPDLLYALLRLHHLDPGARVVSLPADHEPCDDRIFRAEVRTARWALDRHPDEVVLLGMPAARADGRCGYVEPGGPVPDCGGAPIYTVRGFHEAPGARLARYLIATGSLRSSFVLVFRVARLLELLGASKRAQLDRLASHLADPRALQSAYGALAAWSFSRDVLTRATRHLLVLRADPLAAPPPGDGTRPLERIPPARLEPMREHAPSRPEVGALVSS